MVRQRKGDGTSSECCKPQTKNGMVDTGTGNNIKCGTQKEKKPKTYLMCRCLTAVRLNFIVPFLFIAEITLVQTYGVFCLLPAMFGDSAIYQQIIVTIMVAEIFVNYFLLAKTPASFKATKFPRKDLIFDGNLKGVSIEHIQFILLHCK